MGGVWRKVLFHTGPGGMPSCRRSAAAGTLEHEGTVIPR
jgi:hypothetical protein